jgi:hypothetical protein
MTFTAYKLDATGVEMNFVCNNPGEEAFSNWPINITYAELAAVSTQPQMLNLVTTKLNQRYRNVVAMGKLDPLIGQSIVI